MTSQRRHLENLVSMWEKSPVSPPPPPLQPQETAYLSTERGDTAGISAKAGYKVCYSGYKSGTRWGRDKQTGEPF